MMSADQYNLRMSGEDPLYIDSENDWEINYWSAKLKCTKEELKIAAKEVGPKIENIRQFIVMISVVKKRNI